MSFFDNYLEYVSDTESPTLYHRWCAITGIGALLARRAYLPFGHSNIYPNNYVMLLGSPGTRKSTAISIFKNLMVLAGYETFAGNKSSKEKFLQDLYGELEDNGDANDINTKGDPTIANLFGESAHWQEQDPKEMFVAADEFANFTGIGNYEFISLLGELWDNLPYYDLRVKNSKSFRIAQPTVSILSGNTPTGFATMFPPEILGQGFISRMLLIHGEPTGRKITFPKIPDAGHTAELAKELQRLKEINIGAMGLSDTARSAVDCIYQSWQPLEDPRFQHYSTRRLTHLIKLCIIVACARSSTIMEEQDVLMANTMLSYAEDFMPKAMGEFGKGRFSGEADLIVQKLQEKYPEAVSGQVIYGWISKNLDRPQQLADILSGLQQNHRIVASKDGFVYVPQKQKGPRKLVDLSLLKEFNEDENRRRSGITG